MPTSQRKSKWNKFFIFNAGLYAFFGGVAFALCVFGTVTSLRGSFFDLPYGYSPALITILYLPVILWMMATGIGLILGKPWSRISFLVVCYIVLFVGFFILYGFLSLHYSTERLKDFVDLESLRPIYQIFRITSLIFISVFFISLPIGYIFFFNRPAVKEKFAFPQRIK
jgi:hypothetical protein